MSSNQSHRNDSDAIGKIVETSKPESSSRPSFSPLELLKEGAAHSKSGTQHKSDAVTEDGKLKFGNPYPLKDTYKGVTSENLAKGGSEAAASLSPENAAARTTANQFSGPESFLNMFRHQFNNISGGSDTVNRADLEEAAQHSTNPFEKLAASEAVAHFDQLSGISAQYDNDPNALKDRGQLISKKDINWAWDMENGNTYGHDAMDKINALKNGQTFQMDREQKRLNSIAAQDQAEFASWFKN